MNLTITLNEMIEITGNNDLSLQEYLIETYCLTRNNYLSDAWAPLIERFLNAYIPRDKKEQQEWQKKVMTIWHTRHVS